MPFMTHFFYFFVHYVQELWFVLLVGFLLSGIFYKFISTEIVVRHLGEKGLRPILISTVVGAILPICCIGTLPIAVTLKRKGASMGAVLAFLIATPATSVSALIVCWKLLGMTFTVYIFFAVILIGLVMGIIGNGMNIEPDGGISANAGGDCCRREDSDANEGDPVVPVGQKFKEALAYAFIKLPKDIGWQILIGIALASLVAASDPLQNFIREFFVGPVGYAVVLVVGLLDYVCSTASVPMADALVRSGMSHGQALCYLLVGPITSYGTILVIKKDFGKKILAMYLGVISVMSLLAGIVYDFIQ
jgi:uncharacterized membrane protein YraQ (UPF0718 family)